MTDVVGVPVDNTVFDVDIDKNIVAAEDFESKLVEFVVVVVDDDTDETRNAAVGHKSIAGAGADDDDDDDDETRDAAVGHLSIAAAADDDDNTHLETNIIDSEAVTHTSAGMVGLIVDDADADEIAMRTVIHYVRCDCCCAVRGTRLLLFIILKVLLTCCNRNQLNEGATCLKTIF